MPNAATLRKQGRERFNTASRLENDYMRALRSLTRQIDAIIRGMAPHGDISKVLALQRTLEAYGEAIRPWAASVVAKMMARVDQKDAAAWARLGQSIGKQLRRELNEAPTGEAMRKSMAEQVDLIASLPRTAAERVHKIVIEGMTSSRRPKEIAADIMKTGKVTESRARLIALTEVSRAAFELTSARAQHLGSTHYIWRTCHDSAVRDSHKRMDGQVIAWDDPPEVDPGKRYHAGAVFNCRCFCEPLLTAD
jgi:SPP1 gp7 family putative phage head morphogenesis protein